MRGRHEKYPHSESLDPRGDGAEVSDASGPRDAVSDHRRIEERSIALHAAVAEKLRRDPRLMEIARENLERQSRRFTCEGQQPPRWLLEWQAILDRRSLEEILDFMTSRMKRRASFASPALSRGS